MKRYERKSFNRFVANLEAVGYESFELNGKPAVEAEDYRKVIKIAGVTCGARPKGSGRFHIFPI